MILIVPPLISTLISFATSASTEPPAGQVSPVVTPVDASVVLKGLAVSLLGLAISFILMVGQAGMSGRVVSEGRTSLDDWGMSVKRYFLRVLGLFLLYMLISFIMGLLLIPFDLLLRPLTTSPAWRYVLILLLAGASSIFHIILAPAVVDDKGVSDSLSLGLKTIRRQPRAFLGYVGFSYIIQLVVSSVATTETDAIIGSLSLTTMTSSIISTIWSPLHFLWAFLIYAITPKKLS